MATEDSSKERLREAGARLHSVLLRAIAAVVVLVIFAGLAFLVYRGRMGEDGLLLYAGVIVGYLMHATKESVR